MSGIKLTALTVVLHYKARVRRLGGREVDDALGGVRARIGPYRASQAQCVHVQGRLESHFNVARNVAGPKLCPSMPELNSACEGASRSRQSTNLRGVLDLRRRTGERERERGTGERERGTGERDRSAGVGDRAAGEADRPRLTERLRGDASLPFGGGDADMPACCLLQVVVGCRNESEPDVFTSASLPTARVQAGVRNPVESRIDGHTSRHNVCQETIEK